MRSGMIDTQPPPYSAASPVPQAQRPTTVNIPPMPRSTAEPRLLPTPQEGWSPLLMLAIALYCVVYAIMAAKWVAHSELLLWGPALGLLVGLGVAKLPRIPQSLMHIAACLIGYWFAVAVTGLAFQVSGLRVLADLRDALFGGLFSGTISSSKSVFFFYLVFLCFFLGHFGSWLVYRARLPWLVALVYSSIMLVNLNYVEGDNPLIVVVLLASLMILVARVHLVAQLVQWTSEGLYTNPTWVRSFTRRCMSVASVLMIIVLLLGGILPILPQTSGGKAFWDNLNNAVINISSGRVSLQDPGSLLRPNGTQTNFFGDQLRITGSIHLPTGDVLTYSSDGPRYLEGFAYNMFDGRLWTSSVNNGSFYGANVPLPADSRRTDVQEVTTTVKILQPPEGTKHYLFGPAQPVKFTVPTVVYNDGAAVAWTQATPLSQGESYQVVSSIPTSDTTILTALPLPHNDTQGVWRSGLQNSAIYLQVPSNLSSNVEATARNWTQGATDAYGALKMLESRLSDTHTFTYSVNNPPIPDGTNVVDWLLQKRSGYCTYYASAMAVMGRLLGIPTRMVNGFSQGNYDPVRKVWVVTGSDAHSWVQAYFPTIGWVSFDPTPGFSTGAQPDSTQTPSATAQATPTTAATQPTPATGATPAAQATAGAAKKSGTTGSEDTIPGWLQGLLLSAVLLLLVGSLLLLLSGLAVRWWRGLYADSPLVTAMFWRLCLLASWLGFAPKKWQTPHEYGYMLSRHLPQQAQPLRRLTDLFVRERWGAPHQAPRREEQLEVEGFWPNLRTSLVRALLRSKK